METLGTIATSPGPAPISGAISSPTAIGISHHPSAQARTPRVAHSRAYSASRSATERGIAPSELLTRYVVLPRIGKRSRKRSSGSVVGSVIGSHGFGPSCAARPRRDRVHHDGRGDDERG